MEAVQRIIRHTGIDIFPEEIIQWLKLLTSRLSCHTLNDLIGEGSFFLGRGNVIFFFFNVHKRFQHDINPLHFYFLIFIYFLKFLLLLLFYFTILYWFCHTSTCIHHRRTPFPQSIQYSTKLQVQSHPAELCNLFILHN